MCFNSKLLIFLKENFLVDAKPKRKRERQISKIKSL